MIKIKLNFNPSYCNILNSKVDMHDMDFRIEARKRHWRKPHVFWLGRMEVLPNEVRQRIEFYLKVAYHRMVIASGLRGFIRRQRARPAYQQRLAARSRFRTLRAKVNQRYPGVAGESTANPILLN